MRRTVFLPEGGTEIDRIGEVEENLDQFQRKEDELEDNIGEVREDLKDFDFDQVAFEGLKMS